jgi:hypothetical protein
MRASARLSCLGAVVLQRRGYLIYRKAGIFAAPPHGIYVEIYRRTSAELARMQFDFHASPSRATGTLGGTTGQ